TWSLGPTFYRLGLDAAVRFAQEERRKAEEKEKEKGAGAAAAKDKRKSEAEKKDDDELKLHPAEAIEIRLTLPRAQPQGSFVLKNARVVTMKGDAVLDDADVVVTGNRSAAGGPAGRHLGGGEQPRRRPPPGPADEGLRRADDQGLPAAEALPADLVRGGLPRPAHAADRGGRGRAQHRPHDGARRLHVFRALAA